MVKRAASVPPMIAQVTALLAVIVVTAVWFSLTVLVDAAAPVGPVIYGPLVVTVPKYALRAASKPFVALLPLTLSLSLQTLAEPTS